MTLEKCTLGWGKFISDANTWRCIKNSDILICTLNQSVIASNYYSCCSRSVDVFQQCKYPLFQRLYQSLRKLYTIL